MNNDQPFPKTETPAPAPFPKTPVPMNHQENRKPVEFDFFEAVKRTIRGSRITRLAWETNDIFCLMRNEQLQIFIRGEYHSWTVVPGDIEATDWIELPEQSKE